MAGRNGKRTTRSASQAGQAREALSRACQPFKRSMSPTGPVRL